jgi:hypothetical protein
MPAQNSKDQVVNFEDSAFAETHWSGSIEAESSMRERPSIDCHRKALEAARDTLSQRGVLQNSGVK